MAFGYQDEYCVLIGWNELYHGVQVIAIASRSMDDNAPTKQQTATGSRQELFTFSLVKCIHKPAVIVEPDCSFLLRLLMRIASMSRVLLEHGVLYNCFH